MDNQALQPDTPLLSTEMEQPEVDVQSAQDAQNQMIAEILNTPGWKVLEQKLDDHISNFRTGKFMGDTASLKLEEVGQKFVIASTVASICEDIKATVIDAANQVAESVRQRNNQQPK